MVGFPTSRRSHGRDLDMEIKPGTGDVSGIVGDERFVECVAMESLFVGLVEG